MDKFIMTNAEIKMHNKTIIEKYGATPYIVLYGYIPKRITPFLRELVLRRDGMKCTECGTDGLQDLSIRFDIHHRVPQSDGGINHIDNLATICSKCHEKSPNLHEKRR